MQFSCTKYLHIIKSWLKYFPRGPIWQYTSIGCDDEMVLDRQQAIILANDDLDQHLYLDHSASND